jgi:hypothetical protein
MRSTLAVAIIQTIRQCYEGFTKCEVCNAIITCKGQAMTDHLSDAQFQAMVRSNTIENYPIKPKHIANTNSYVVRALQECAEKLLVANPTE